VPVLHLSKVKASCECRACFALALRQILVELDSQVSCASGSRTRLHIIGGQAFIEPVGRPALSPWILQ